MSIPALLEWLESRVWACESQLKYERENHPGSPCEELRGREVAYRDVLEKLKGLDS